MLDAYIIDERRRREQDRKKGLKLNLEVPLSDASPSSLEEHYPTSPISDLEIGIVIRYDIPSNDDSSSPNGSSNDAGKEIYIPL